ncbi:hypothetical protein D9613_003541 [Agrocybe pediades]|uniref:Lectin n=1 Tax=Agrocybe pediades TaxID=84607 RepID=A0A8H4VLR7_9AGAR|nr:hypothetical protein D9613_003541 [Agrocybe pediades]
MFLALFYITDSVSILHIEGLRSVSYASSTTSDKMFFKAAIFVSLAFYIGQALAVDLKNCNWIWTNDQSKNSGHSDELRAFQRAFHHADGKVPVAAEFFVASGHPHDLFVNDRHIGWFDGFEHGNDGAMGRIHTVPLESGPSIFTIRTQGSHRQIPAGLLSSIAIKFHDGSHEEFPSDSEWMAATEPYGDERPRWGKAKVLGLYGAKPWGTVIIVPEPVHAHFGGGGEHRPHHPHVPATPAAPLTINNASWVWTNETTTQPFGSGGPVYDNMAPGGARAFRKTIHVGKGTTINALNITIEVDNEYTLYVQGQQIGSQDDWSTAFHYLVNLTHPVSGPGSIVVAVNGTNTDTLGPAGLLAFIDLLGPKGRGKVGSQGIVMTDGTWKFDNTVPTGFEQPTFDDSTWGNVTVVGTYAKGPYQPSTLHDSPTIANVTA